MAENALRQVWTDFFKRAPIRAVNCAASLNDSRGKLVHGKEVLLNLRIKLKIKIKLLSPQTMNLEVFLCHETYELSKRLLRFLSGQDNSYEGVRLLGRQLTFQMPKQRILVFIKVWTLHLVAVTQKFDDAAARNHYGPVAVWLDTLNSLQHLSKGYRLHRQVTLSTLCLV